MSPLSFYPANRALYISMSLSTFAICSYYIYAGTESSYQFYTAIAAAIGIFIWGGYFARLRFIVDDNGVSRRALTTKRLDWNEIKDIKLTDSAAFGMASCKLIFSATNDRSMEISSDILDLESVQDLVKELRVQGKLAPAITEDELSEEL